MNGCTKMFVVQTVAAERSGSGPQSFCQSVRQTDGLNSLEMLRSETVNLLAMEVIVKKLNQCEAGVYPRLAALNVSSTSGQELCESDLLLGLAVIQIKSSFIRIALFIQAALQLSDSLVKTE